MVRRALLKEVFQGIETMGVGAFSVEESDNNSRHDGVERERPHDLNKMVGIFNI